MEEKESELKKEYNKLHERYTEVRLGLKGLKVSYFS